MEKQPQQEPRWQTDGNNRVRTDGTRWQVRNETSARPYGGPLKNYIKELQRLLEEHPEADANLRDEYRDESATIIVQWWEDAPASHRDVVQYLKWEEERKQRQKDDDARQLAEMRRKHPELFK